MKRAGKEKDTCDLPLCFCWLFSSRAVQRMSKVVEPLRPWDFRISNWTVTPGWPAPTMIRTRRNSQRRTRRDDQYPALSAVECSRIARCDSNEKGSDMPEPVKIETAVATASGTRVCLVCGEKITDRTFLVGFAATNSDIRSEITLHLSCALQLWQALGDEIGAVRL